MKGNLFWLISPHLGFAAKAVMRKLIKSYLGLLVCSYLCQNSNARLKHNIDEFLLEDERSHRIKQNYVRLRPMEGEILNDNLGMAYAFQSDPDSTADDLPPLVVDYANMIRNDIVLLDNSVETRTRKRGDIKADKKMLRSAWTVEPPCSCEENLKKQQVDLGEDYFPRYVQNKSCSQRLCGEHYSCQTSPYTLTILKRKTDLTETSKIDEDLDRWEAKQLSVTVGCICMRDYIVHN